MALNNPCALYFDGVNDYVRVSYDAKLRPTQLSIMAIITKTKNAQQHIASTAQFGGYFFWIHGSGYLGISVYIGGRYRTLYSQASLANETYSVCGTYDGSHMRLYIDGELAAEQAQTGNIAYSANNALMIGCDSGAGSNPDPSAPFYYQGAIDNVSFWNRGLTPEEVYTYHDRRLRGDENGLVAYYKLDETSGTIAYDSGPNGLNGYIVGATRIDGLADLVIGQGIARLASATAYGAATGTAKPIRGRGLRAAAHGTATATARPHKIAIARATAQGAATAKAVILVLTIPKGVYNLEADQIFNRNQPITPDSLANYIEVWVNPLKPVAEPEEVYKTDEDDPIPINAGETKTVTIHYKKEPVTDVSISFVSSPPYATIDNIKYYAWGADVTVTSPDAGTFELVATGKPLEVQGRELVVRKDETSILENGIKKYTFDNPFVQDRATAEMIAEKLLAFAVPQADIEIDWRGDPALVLADVTMIPEFQRQGLDQRGIFYVTKQELKYDGGLRAKLAGRKMGGE